MSELADRLSIQELVHKYCFALDGNRPDDFVALFADGGTFRAGSTGRAETDAELRAIVETIADRWEFVIHLAGNPVIDIDDDLASGTWYYMLSFKPADDPLHIGFGRYEGVFERIDQQWKIMELTATRSATAPVSEDG